MNSKTLVVKDNRLVQASYTLGLIEQRIVLMAIAWSRQNDVDLTHDAWVELNAGDYASLYEITLDAAYKQLSGACASLQDRQIKIMGVDRVTRAPAVYISKWVTDAVYVQDIGLVRLRFSEMLVPYVSDLDSHFTSYAIGSVCGLSTNYAIRLYELLLQYKTIGKRKIMIGDLKDYLECNTTAYDRLDNFKRRVVDAAIDQINDCTDLICTYDTIKMGKRVIGFDFKIKAKQATIKQVKPKPTKPAASPSHAPSVALSMSERAMLREINESRAPADQLTDRQVFNMCRDQSTDPFFLLNTLLKS